MIYKIYGKQMYDAMTNGAKFIMFSSNGEFALVKSETTVPNYLEVYEESEMNSLYADPLYKQPCKDC